MIKFGTGGWRAIIGDGFTKENIQKLTKALAMKMKAEGVEKEDICIGYDRRFPGKRGSLCGPVRCLAAEGIRAWFHQQVLTHTTYHVLCDGTQPAIRHDGDSQP